MQFISKYLKTVTKLTCSLFIILSNGVGDLQFPLSKHSDFFLHILLPIFTQTTNSTRKLHWTMNNNRNRLILDFQRYPDCNQNKNTTAGRPRAFKANSMLTYSQSIVDSKPTYYSTFARPYRLRSTSTILFIFLLFPPSDSNELCFRLLCSSYRVLGARHYLVDFCMDLDNNTGRCEQYIIVTVFCFVIPEVWLNMVSSIGSPKM